MDRRRMTDIATDFEGSTYDGRGSEVHSVWRTAHTGTIRYTTFDGEVRVARESYDTWTDNASAELVGAIERWEDVQDALELWEARIGGTDADEGDEPIAAEGIPAAGSIDREAIAAEVILDQPRHIAVPMIAALLAAGTGEQR